MSAIALGLISLALGFVHQGISKWLPFRKLDASPEVALDVLAVGAAAVFGLGVEYILDAPFILLMDTAWINHWYDALQGWSLWLLVALNLVLCDLYAYWAHRLLHTSPLWATHAWHHSPKHLSWASGLRGSPVHVLVLYVPYYAGALLFPVPEVGYAAAFVALINIANQHFIHSNIRVPFSRYVEWVFVTPRSHFVHHSRRREFSDTNYGFLFTVWDRLFGTYTDPDKVPADDPLGLNYQNTTWRLVVGLPPPANR